MKKRIMAWVLALCMGVPVCAGAAQEQEVYGYPTEDALRKLPKTVTRGDFLEALASASGEDVSDSAWIDMEEYFTDGVEASDEVKWTFAKWILNGAAQDGEKAVLRLDDLITRQEAAALLGRYLDYRYTALPAGCGTGSPDPYNIAEWAQNGVSKCKGFYIISFF